MTLLLAMTLLPMTLLAIGAPLASAHRRAPATRTCLGLGLGFGFGLELDLTLTLTLTLT